MNGESTVDSTCREWSAVWSNIRGQAISSIELLAPRYEVNSSALEKKVLLHLPRLSASEIADHSALNLEIERLAVITSEAAAPYRSMELGSQIETLTKDNFHVDEIPTSMASVIHQRFHYLGTERSGLQFGLFHDQRPDLPAAIATVSDLDVEHLRAHLNEAGGAILSRIYAFPWAPRNCISALLGAVSRNVQKTLFTYVNPNLGFTGSSYRATNWRLIDKKSIVYRYAMNDYVTARQAAKIPPADLTYSQFALEPLRIWRHERK